MTKLSGTWTLVIPNQRLWYHRVVITGSDNADGVYLVTDYIPTVQGVNFEVKSQNVTLFENDMFKWADSFQKDVMSWESLKGVIVTIFAARLAENLTDASGDNFYGLIIECTSSDPELVAPPLNNPPMILTIPENYVRNRENDDHRSQ